MDKIFNKKPWVEPLSVAGTSCESGRSDSETSSTEETREQSGNETYNNIYYSLLVINVLLFESETK